MAIELLLKNIDDIHPDPILNRTSTLKRGDLVFAKTLPDDWNEYETLPEFARLIVSDANISGVLEYMEPWCVDVNYETLSYDDENDLYGIRMYSTTSGLANLGIIESDDFLHNLDNWNLTVSGVSTNEVIFFADMKEVFKSQSFWGGVSDGIVITPVSFNSSTNIHTLKLSYSGFVPGKIRTEARAMLEMILDNHEANIIQESIYGQLMEIEIPSTAAVMKFKQNMNLLLKKIIFSRRYYITNGAMNAIETYMQNNNGNAMTTTKSVLLGYLNDRTLE